MVIGVRYGVQMAEMFYQGHLYCIISCVFESLLRSNTLGRPIDMYVINTLISF